jgi:hypothetical protein
MTKYLLLRDNKQTGPYDLDELRTKGLKAYDLVWIDGKSAAWRYPSEVEELKSFAPAVEEQPFDRFYKKPSQNAQPAAALTRQPAEQSSQSSFTPGVTLYSSNPNTNGSSGNNSIGSGNNSIGEPSAVPGKRIIYVTLPAGKGAISSKEPLSRTQNSGSLIAVQDIDRPRLQDTGRPQLKDAGTAARHEPQLSSLYVQNVQNIPPQTQPQQELQSPSMPSEEKFSHTGNEMWKGAVEMAPRNKKPGLRRIAQPIGVLLCILALLAAGIFIGLSINRDSFGFSQKLAAKDGSSASVPPTRHNDPPASQMPVYNTSAVLTQQPEDSALRPVNTNTAASVLSNNPVNSQAAGPASIAPVQKKKTGSQKEKALASAQKDPASTPLKDSAATSFQAMHREAIHRSDPAPDKDVIKNNISNLVSAGSGKYNVGAFGGISDLQITVSNHSIYPLDLVVVEVRYIQANKKVFKTENLYFRDIGAGAALMQEAPKSSRGIKVDYKITLINSKELGLSYSGI